MEMESGNDRGSAADNKSLNDIQHSTAITVYPAESAERGPQFRFETAYNFYKNDQFHGSHASVRKSVAYSILMTT